FAFVEVDARELVAAQQGQGGRAVALAHGGGERGEVEGGVLAVAAGEVDVAGGEGEDGGGWSQSAPTRPGGATFPARGRGVGCCARVGCGVRIRRGARLGCGVGRGGGEDAGEHVACFHGRQLVGVAEQDQAGAVGNGFDQLGHQRQVDHRGFVHHRHVQREGVAGVVAEVRAVGDGAEQAVQGGAGGGQVGGEVGVDAVVGEGLHGAADAFGHAFGGAAGGRGQGDARRRGASLQRLCDQQHQHAGDGGGLAGAGAAGDQQQGVVERGGGGLGLEVVAGCSLGEELGEEVRQLGGNLRGGGA